MIKISKSSKIHSCNPIQDASDKGYFPNRFCFGFRGAGIHDKIAIPHKKSSSTRKYIDPLQPSSDIRGES